MLTLQQLITDASNKRASDVHIIAGLPIKIRVDGKLLNLYDAVVSPQVSEAIARQLAGEKFEEISTIGELDMASTVGDNIRLRISIFRQRGNVSIAIRLLNNNIPTLDELSMPPVLKTFADYKNGLVLITGETGAGKTTTIASIIDMINKTKACHIITVEDPIEYIFKPDQGIINQREIGIDTESYDKAFRSILREDPNVIMIGEMRDQKTIETALTAAETGHLVFATLHTKSASETVDRILSIFPEGMQKQVRVQLGSTLNAVVSQTLIPREKGEGRIAACEVMIVTSAIRNIIREGKTSQLDSFIGLGSNEGSITMDNALADLMRQGIISKQEALDNARDKEHFPRF